MPKSLVLIGVAAAALVGRSIGDRSFVPASGDISRREALDRAGRLFEMLDINHDGLLTRSEAKTEGAELQAERVKTGVDIAPGVGGHTAHYMERRFAFSRSITRRQFERAFLAHFDRMDRNHDGILTPEERARAQ